ncbi:NlpC/P60 family protein [Streptomyces turgidiscabies]|uniref:Cell wall-associated NlpC family hydrolase n=1 Tax=Streptomyces turgidiscabies TaxID=85558 RepID=A0ABU0RHX5_9ACTN|nr:NlpC/P60 family protein [Streptomyces turgidiscabies]MDQ0931576.1 cell wall-associated NlpC family hydrolase [Streptomyces turgidiscabies]
MASHRRPKQPSRTRVTVLTTAAAAAVALSANAANAAPSEKPSMDEVKAKVDKLYEQTEQASEKLNGAKEKQSRLEKEISTLQDNVARGQGDLNDLRDSLGLAAAAQYRTGSIDPSVQLFLSADPDDYLDKASTMDQLSGQQVETLKKVTEKQRALAQQRSEATEKLRDLADTRSELAEKKKEVQGKLAQARTLLNSMTAAQKAAIAAEDARASRASQRTALDDGGAAAVTGRAGSAYAAAQSKIGSPYVYGADGASTFDCSGFTSWAFAQVGIHIPRTSQEQANAGTRIYSQSALQVGDLVIFYGDHHHVGFYAGNGQVLHAPRSNTVVRYESINNMPFQFGVRI